MLNNKYGHKSIQLLHEKMHLHLYGTNNGLDQVMNNQSNIHLAVKSNVKSTGKTFIYTVRQLFRPEDHLSDKTQYNTLACTEQHKTRPRTNVTQEVASTLCFKRKLHPSITNDNYGTTAVKIIIGGWSVLFLKYSVVHKVL